MEIEALEVGLARTGRGDRRGTRLAPDTQDVGPGPPPEGDAPLHGGAADAGECERLLGERIGGRHARAVGLQAAALEQAMHTGADCGVLISMRQFGSLTPVPLRGYD